jgi:hypothetical protein
MQAGNEKDQQTRGVQPNYCILNNPYTKKESNSNNKDQDENLKQKVLTAKIGDEFHTLKEAKELPEWPEWEQAI